MNEANPPPHNTPSRRVLVLYAHPGQRHSQVNSRMAAAAEQIEQVTFVDLYAEYPRFKIDIDREQQRLQDHDTIVMQCPLYWYSTPSLLKEWQDLVFEYGWAYGPGGDQLAGKSCQLAITTGGREAHYRSASDNPSSLRTLLSPLEQTALFCQMRFLPPFVLFAALHDVHDDRLITHVKGYRRLLEALRDDRLNLEQAMQSAWLTSTTLPIYPTNNDQTITD